MILLASNIACAPPERCTSTSTSVRCPHETTTLHAAGLARDVLWSLPQRDPPPDGWPAALLFQGSGFPAGTYWSSVRGAPFGAVHQVELTAALLDAGIAVFTPKALGGGLTCWNTNLPPWSWDWEDSPDDALMDELFAGFADGTFGPIDDRVLFAGGISSGGYMASRLAITWPDRFDAVAVVAASYATCAGPVCTIPDDAPLDGHPPTVFVHGKLDPVVPIVTMHAYRERLDTLGVETDALEAPLGLHAWPDGSPETVRDWFVDHAADGLVTSSPAEGR